MINILKDLGDSENAEENIGVDKCVKMMYKHIHGFGETNRDHGNIRVPTEISKHDSMIFHDQQCNFHDFLMHGLQPPLLAASSPC